MKGTNLTKLVIKLEHTGWVHMCYVPSELYQAWKEQTQTTFCDWGDTLTRWVKEDFNADVQAGTVLGFNEVKMLVKKHYKDTYPDVYLDQPTDRQGWLRVWVIKKMKEELELNGEQSIKNTDE